MSLHDTPFFKSWEDLIGENIIIGDPNPGSFLGFVTNPTDPSGVLTRRDLLLFLCHDVLGHVLYYDEDVDGTKRYECLECHRLDK